MKQNTMLQNFEWYLPADGQFWNQCAARAQELSDLGFTQIWLPPAYKGASGKNDVGYGVYDLYDLGEFDQKGIVPTKYGTKEEYLATIDALHQAGLQVLADVVLNHRMGADEAEEIKAIRSSDEDRRCQVGESAPIKAWTRFTFPGRKGKYSDFIWNWTHFDGVDWDEKNKSGGVFQIQGKSWDDEVDGERGNYDYLMGADLDMSNPEVTDELYRWGRWYLETTGVDGFRLDAVKHIRFTFYTRWLTRLRQNTGLALPAVGEYWNPDIDALCHYLDSSGQVMSLFDVPLHFHFYEASHDWGNYDMRELLKDTLVERRPELAVTFVDNHDTQPGQALQSWIEDWFKPLAYAIILLRQQGTPCVFYGDLRGIPHDSIPPVPGLDKLLWARQNCAWGRQTDYFDHPNLVGWTRSGSEEMPGSGLAVLMSDGPGGEKKMCLGAERAGEVFVDCTGNRPERLTLDDTGSARFPVGGGSVSVWVSEKIAPKTEPVPEGEASLTEE